MFGALKLELRWNFKVPHVLEVLIHLKSLKSKTPTKKMEFQFKEAKFRYMVI